MGWHDGKGMWFSDNTSIELQCEYENHYVDGETGDWYEKDLNNQWWVDAGGCELGPFNTLEHACECMEARNARKER